MSYCHIICSCDMHSHVQRGNEENPIEMMTGVGVLDGYYGGSSPGYNWGSFASGVKSVYDGLIKP